MPAQKPLVKQPCKFVLAGIPRSLMSLTLSCFRSSMHLGSIIAKQSVAQGQGALDPTGSFWICGGRKVWYPCCKRLQVLIPCLGCCPHRPKRCLSDIDNVLQPICSAFYPFRIICRGLLRLPLTTNYKCAQTWSLRLWNLACLHIILLCQLTNYFILYLLTLFILHANMCLLWERKPRNTWSRTAQRLVRSGESKLDYSTLLHWVSSGDYKGWWIF